MLTWGQDFPDLPCAVLFDPEEWQAAWIGAKHSPPPQRPPTLQEMVQVIARFGGFLGRKSDGHPGSKALWIDLQRVREWAIGIAVAKESSSQLVDCG